MGRERDLYVLVPDAAGEAMLVARAQGLVSVPILRGDGGAAGVLAAVRREWGLELPHLRPARFVRQQGVTTMALHEMDAPPPGSAPPPGTEWLPLDRADFMRLGPPELHAAIESWIKVQQGAAVPAARPPWARPGWLAEATRWMRERAAAVALDPTGEPEMVAQWPLSSVLRLDTTGGRLYLKAVFSLFWHEPAMTEALAAKHPTLVPELVAVDTERGWMLLHELAGVPLGDTDVAGWGDGLAAMATIQRAWIGAEDDLFAFGAHDRTLAPLARDIRDAVDAAALPEDERARFQAAIPELERRVDELAESAVPQTLIHGDLHPWNLMRDGKSLRIFDWSDACVSHPFFDLPTFLSRADEAARAALLDAYLECWVDHAPAEGLRRLVALAEPLAHVHHATSYLRILDAMEPDDRWWFADEPRRWLEGAVELVERAD